MTTENQAKAQYTFDVIAAHLLIQGQPSTSLTPDGYGGTVFGCAYRGDNGLRCAVGFCIPNENYHVDLEGKSATAQEVLDAIGPQYCNDRDFLADLQEIHDGLDNLTGWSDDLRAFASNNNLDAAIVDTVQTAQVPQPTALAVAHA